VSCRASQQGFAIALVLWTIAGMSLLVAAVIHFARDDIGMAEHRILEAKATAVTRGAALLIMRARSAPESEQLEEEDPGAQKARKMRESILPLAGYLGDQELKMTAQIYPLQGYVSLVSAPKAELARLFELVGGADAGLADRYAEIVVAARQEVPLVHPSQLLSMPGFSKQIYDRIKTYVHAYASGPIDPASGPPRVAAAMKQEEQELGDDLQYDEGVAAAGSGAGGVCTALTFDCMDAMMANGVMAGVSVVEVTMQSAAGNALVRAMISDGQPRIVAMESAAVARGTR
jgi:general secretion pathway protein K